MAARAVRVRRLGSLLPGRLLFPYIGRAVGGISALQHVNCSCLARRWEVREHARNRGGMPLAAV
jgi:hypothetical protein